MIALNAQPFLTNDENPEEVLMAYRHYFSDIEQGFTGSLQDLIRIVLALTAAIEAPLL